MTTLADYWERLSGEDKNLIIELLKIYRGRDNLHLGLLALISVDEVLQVVKNQPRSPAEIEAWRTMKPTSPIQEKRYHNTLDRIIHILTDSKEVRGVYGWEAPKRGFY